MAAAARPRYPPRRAADPALGDWAISPPPASLGVPSTAAHPAGACHGLRRRGRAFASLDQYRAATVGEAMSANCGHSNERARRALVTTRARHLANRHTPLSSTGTIHRPALDLSSRSSGPVLEPHFLSPRARVRV